MAQPTTASWKKMTIWLGDGASPQNFVKPCALTNKRFAMTKELTEQVLPDCDDDDIVPYVARDSRSLSGTFAGSGVLAFESFDEWRNFAANPDPQDVRIVIDHDLGGYWQGAFHLGTFELTGNEGDGKISISVEGSSDGAFTWQNAT
jgi:hypothetical protein